MATNRDEISIIVRIEEFEIFREVGPERFHGLLEQAFIVVGLPEFFGLIFVDHLDLLLAGTCHCCLRVNRVHLVVIR